MKTVSVASQKGGCGKSTLSRHGSVILPNSILLDLDPQGTTRRWLKRREDGGVYEPRTLIATPARAAEAARKAEEVGCEWLVVDTPPEHDDQRAIRAAIEIADYVLIPCKPSPDDMDVIPKTVKLARDSGKPFGIVMTMFRHSGFDEAACQLMEKLADRLQGDFAPVRIVNRVAYVQSVYEAKAVTEYAPKSQAAAEIRKLWDWVAERVQQKETV